MKYIKRVFCVMFGIVILAVVINSKTTFFKDIGQYMPFMDEKFPYAAKYISKVSDELNEQISKIPSPVEIYAKIRNTDIPINPNDVATNSYYAGDTMLNFCNVQNFSIEPFGDELDVYGVLSKDDGQYLVYQFLDENGEVLSQYTGSCDADGKYREIMDIPKSTYQFTVFTGHKRYGDFISQVYNYVFLTEESGGSWKIKFSPVTEHNVTEYEKDKSLSVALKGTYAICSNEESIRNLALDITNGVGTNYEKALALHDWVCNNIYYDTDSLFGEYNTAEYVATDVVRTKKAVCLGYANLYSALCRSISIPCNVVVGYALGVGNDDEITWSEETVNTTEANHAWNEVYIDNRWVIVDSTWDSRNKIVNGTMQNGDGISHLYFDANINFFSANHKIIEYKRR